MTIADGIINAVHEASAHAKEGLPLGGWLCNCEHSVESVFSAVRNLGGCVSTVPVRARIEAAFAEKLAESRRLSGGVCEQASGSGYCCSYHDGFQDALDLGLLAVLTVLGVENE